MKYTRLAAIDIGSNSVRLLVTNAIMDRKEVLFKKASLNRLPIRLGEDAFMRGKIGIRNTERLLWGMEAF